MLVTTESMSAIFTKYYFQLGKFPITLHHFTAPDASDPHDHPYGFTATVIAGGYMEERWHSSSRGWGYEMYRRHAGDTFTVAATDIHRIVELSEGECVTAIRWHDEVPRRESKVWQFTNGKAQWRFWWSEEWQDAATSYCGV